jgi:MFS family permease
MATDFVGNFQDIPTALAAGLNTAFFNFGAILPGIIFAVLLVIVGWLIAILVAKIFKKLFDIVKFEEFLGSHRLDDALGDVKVSKVITQLVKYYVLLIFVQYAVSLLAPGTLTDFLNQLLVFAPKFIGAVLIIVFAAIIGELAKEKVLEVHEKEQYMRLFGAGAKYLVLFMGLVMGLQMVGFPTDILTSTFITILQALGFAFALAFGLAFGFGGQDAAKDWIKEGRKRFHL